MPKKQNTYTSVGRKTHISQQKFDFFSYHDTSYINGYQMTLSKSQKRWLQKSFYLDNLCESDQSRQCWLGSDIAVNMTPEDIANERLSDVIEW